MATEMFESQRALLAYLNKNENDRSLIQRMMKRWEVYKEWWVYYLVVGEEKIVEKAEQRTGDSSKIDDNELKDLKRMNDKLMAAYKKERDKNEVYMWMYDHLIFFYNKFLDYKKFVEWKVFWQAEFNKRERGTQDTMETVRPDVYARYNFEYWEVEDEECKAVEAIINERWKELSELPF